jgi:hypothetical protein
MERLPRKGQADGDAGSVSPGAVVRLQLAGTAPGVHPDDLNRS